MRLLMLGGTHFVGRAVTEEALARGWQVTTFNRGRTEPPPGVSTLIGDRTGDLSALENGEWDVVVDTWSGAPTIVRDAANLLSGRAAQYIYVSSRSVHPFPTPPNATEDAPVVDGSPDAGEVGYAEDKRGGELAAEQAFGDRALFVRAGLILGPYEDIGRLPWWLNRMARGGPVLAPAPADSGLQYIDVRDLATWTVDAAEQKLGGPYNMVSTPGHTTMRELLEACISVTGSDAELRWTDPDAILAAGVEPWSNLPVWLPQGELYDTLHMGNVDKALATGLRCRPVQETVADTWAWLQTLGGQAPQRPDRPPVGLDPDLEAKVLAQHS
ncbi:reductase [Actinomadura barringtoniae]|uniref:Reductase n=1 Tax=Actinomadura barringtoniae TaxID=1427535 RepID=A0A939PBC5_9ACTN|nr:NAD-dependent epimerase/dehydratase family protein [Actinomadura barringtoniae]MBO2446474.1 reductase [Actinomadura barringtoniae]